MEKGKLILGQHVSKCISTQDVRRLHLLVLRKFEK